MHGVVICTGVDIYICTLMFATATTMDSLFTRPTTHKSNHHALAVQVLNACYKFVHPYTMPRHAKATCHTLAEPYVVQLYSIYHMPDVR